jgi:DNA-binding Lrp family transcriptional regulator
MPLAALDRIDHALVVELQRNSRIANKELAARVGIAPSTCLERVRRLVERSVLRGFHAEVDLASIGRSIQAIIGVRLRVHSRSVIDEFYRHVLELPETVSVFHVGGADDYLVHVAVRDTTQLRNLVLDGFTTRREVEHVETRIIFEHARRPAIEPLGSY